MRIIAGIYRSRILSSPKGDKTRPTTDRARESLFNVLEHRITFDGSSVLDLFSGSGALGFEALSRGSANAVFVDNTKEAASVIKDNAVSLGAADVVTIIKKDVYSWIPSANRQFDIIFADPPYDDDRTLAELPRLLAVHGLLSAHSVVIVEHRTGTSVTAPEGLVIIKEISAGEAHFTLLTPVNGR
jgi:16S rRNA (guanine966-N2)-methyltransferase